MALETAQLSWNANTEPDLAGYKLYYGQQPGVYSGNVTLDVVTSTVLQAEFNNDGQWYFAISAFDTSNNESAKSASVTKRIVRVASRLVRRK